MHTPQTPMLSNPSKDDPIPAGTLAYFQGRNRSRIYEAILREFLRANISQATLTRRMGKRAEQVSRLLGAPGNWTLDTVSDLLFAISGAEPVYGIQYPLREPPRNYRQPEWLTLTTSELVPQNADKYQFVKNGFLTNAAGSSSTSSIIPIYGVNQR